MTEKQKVWNFVGSGYKIGTLEEGRLGWEPCDGEDSQAGALGMGVKGLIGGGWRGTGKGSGADKVRERSRSRLSSGFGN